MKGRVHVGLSNGGSPQAAAFDFHPHLSLESRENPFGREAFNPPMVSDVTIQIEDPAHTTTQPWWGFGDFRISDEIYRYKGDPRQDPDLRAGSLRSRLTTATVRMSPDRRGRSSGGTR